MTTVDRKRRHMGWSGVAGILLLAVLAFCGADHQAWADEDVEHIVDGRNPNDFENRGQIDRMGDDVIVINDMQKRLASNVKYYRPGRIRITKDAFGEGCTVGYLTNSKGEISSLWLLEQSRGPKGPGRGRGDDHSDEKGRKGGNGG
jgi:hypothetical protein